MDDSDLQDAMRADSMMRQACERLQKNIKTDRGMKSDQQVFEYMDRQKDKMNRYAFMGGFGMAQPIGAMTAVGEATSQKWTPEQVKDEILRSHVQRVLAGQEGDREGYMRLFGRCEGLCWLINNEDNYGRGGQ